MESPETEWVGYVQATSTPMRSKRDSIVILGEPMFFLMMLTGYNLNECVQKHGAELDRQMPSMNHVTDNC